MTTSRFPIAYGYIRFTFIVTYWIRNADGFHFSTFSTDICPDLSDPANGMVIMMGTSAWDTAIYTCDAGYELIGSTTVTCMDDGTWSDGPLMCRRKFKPCLP